MCTRLARAASARRHPRAKPSTTTRISPRCFSRRRGSRWSTARHLASRPSSAYPMRQASTPLKRRAAAFSAFAPVSARQVIMGADEAEGEAMKFSKLSTASQVEGKIMEIRKGAVTAIVYVQIAGDTMVEVSVTIASLETLGLFEGKSVTLIINPVDIMIGCE